MEKQKKNQTMPKGGAKGGTRFPRVDLDKAIQYAKKLVSKTHTGALPKEIVKPGVFNTSGPEANVRISALKQYGLLEESQGMIKATDLAKEIVASPEEEIVPLLQKACLAPKLFQQVVDTYNGDTISPAKIKQFSIKAAVHPDSADSFTQTVTSSLVHAKLAEFNGEDIKISSSKEVAEFRKSSEFEPQGAESGSPDSDEENGGEDVQSPAFQQAQSAVNISINLDSTMDAEKLEKMLKLLKTYGAIR